MAAGVLRFLAFIYLFHYLNWFAKTEELPQLWHKVSRSVEADMDSYAVCGVAWDVISGTSQWVFIL